MHKHNDNAFRQVGTAIGVGLLAGLAGTLAISLSQKIEMKITQRKPSTTPADAVEKTLDLKAADEGKKTALSHKIHWVYGTCWGVTRGLISLTGIRGIPATVLHFTAVYAKELTLLPGLHLTPPVTEQSAKTIAIDALHHAVYATAAGCAFDPIMNH